MGSGSSRRGPPLLARVQQAVEKRSAARQSRFCGSHVFESSVPTRCGAECQPGLGLVVAARRQHPRRRFRLKAARSRQRAWFRLAEFPILAGWQRRRLSCGGVCEARRIAQAISEGPLRVKKKRGAGDAALGGESIWDLDAEQAEDWLRVAAVGQGASREGD